MNQPFTPAVTPPDQIKDPALWFAFSGDQLLINEDEANPIPQSRDFADFGLTRVRQQYLGQLGEQHCFSIELASDTAVPQNMALTNLRAMLDTLDDDLLGVAGRAVQIVAWDSTHQHCGRCGAETKDLIGERAKKCPACGLSNYPRISPCIIVTVNKGDKILLARNPRWPAGRYSNVAGFVEPGETLEEAVEREVMEEVGITVKNIRYFGSQPWPFPNSLMMGFTAEYASGELRPDDFEIEDAQWFSVDDLPQVPTSVSISGQLIEAFLNRQT